MIFLETNRIVTILDNIAKPPPPPTQPRKRNHSRINSTAMEPFAIVGVSLKMPQEAVSESSLWEVIENRRNLMTEWPESRAEVDAFHDGGSKKPNTVCQYSNS